MLDILLNSLSPSILLLLGGAVGLLGSVLTMAAGLAVESGRPVWRTIAHGLPILTAAIVATCLGHAEMAIGMIFGTSVASLSAVAGFIALTRPLDALPRRAERLWSFLPVPATLAFVLGLNGEVGLFDAALLAAQGVLVLAICIEPLNNAGDPGTPAAATDPAPTPRRTSPLEVVFALLLAALSAWAATRGAENLSQHDIRYSTETLASILLSIALAMPMISTGMQAASEGRTWNPLTGQIGLVLLNLCVALPLVIVLGAWLNRTPLPSSSPLWGIPSLPHFTWGTVLFPRIVWRIDALAIVILSLVLLPVASGRIRLDRRLAGWLVGGYFAYMLVVFIADLHR